MARRPSEKISGILSGAAGEYFVAAELSRLGFIASLTLKNTMGVDILVTNKEVTTTVSIQVKTNQGSSKKWLLNQNAELLFKRHFFYVFVNLFDKVKHPEFHVVPSRTVARFVKESHQTWLATPGKRSQTHKDTLMRQFKDPNGTYLGRWDLLRL